MSCACLRQVLDNGKGTYQTQLLDVLVLDLRSLQASKVKEISLTGKNLAMWKNRTFPPREALV